MRFEEAITRRIQFEVTQMRTGIKVGGFFFNYLILAAENGPVCLHFFSLMPGGCNIFCKIRCPHNKGAQTEERNKGKPSVPGPPTPSHTDLKWSPVIDQFQPCLEQNRSLYSCTLASSSLARFHRE